ncbi:MAG: rhodanese-related sulfurtransferase [Saprospiraceae bacterium]|nr:rhodanese-related sulfurtransferase [Saprospiraceae bacterium]
MTLRLYNLVNREELIRKMKESQEARTTISFYKYYNILNPPFFRNHLYDRYEQLGVLGRIYIASEGINAQISVPSARLEDFKKVMNDIDFLNGIRLNFAIEDDGKSFFKLNIKVRKKIVADGIEDPDFNASDCGVHLNALEFNEIISKENTVVVDMRNHYESEVGHFENAICPEVVTFRESLPIISDMLAEHKDKNLVMYCTGGIRCEKASAYLKYKGYKNVFQLNGGIIEYARQVNEQHLENKFKGKNFVFDERLGERISDQIISRCHQCGALCDNHVNCKNDQCHILFIQCPACAQKYEDCCSRRCSDFVKLDDAEKQQIREQLEFNGSKFSKGRYKALGKDEALVLH